MTEDEVYLAVKNLADEYGLELTENTYNICRFRARANLPLSKCPCSPNDPMRGCISQKCLDEIQKFGQCHCRCYRKKV